MTMFTAEGLIRASVIAGEGDLPCPSVVGNAYLRWLWTQSIRRILEDTFAGQRPDGWRAGPAGTAVRVERRA